MRFAWRTPTTRGRRPNGTFAPGTSGNPGGMPRKPSEVVELLRTSSPTLMRKAIAMALSGDATVMTALPPAASCHAVAWGRCHSRWRDRRSRRSDVTIAAVASGMLTAEEATQLAGLINIRAQIAALPDLAERLQRLETILAGKPGMVLDAALELDKS